MDAFTEYVESWAEAAEAGETFAWEAEVDPEVVRRLAAHWARLVTLARSEPERWGIRPAPEEGEDFYNALTMAMLAATSVDDAEHFATRLEEVVPAFTESVPITDEAAAKTVLLVDDNEDIRLLMRLAIQRDGRFVVCGEAADGAAALEQCEARCPDAILLDLLMPVMDGFTALPLLKQKCPNTNVVVFSAVPSPETRSRVMALGATAFLQKTVDAEAVLSALGGG